MNKRYLSVKVSPISQVIARGDSLRKQGRNILDAGVGEFYKRTPQEIVDAALEGARSAEFGYTDVRGIDALRSTVVEKYRSEYGFSGVCDSNVIVTAGAKHALFNCMQALLNDGDEVVVFSPYWPSYPAMITAAGGRPIIVSAPEFGVEYDIQKFSSCLSSRVRAVIINSPSNPSGQKIQQKTLRLLLNSILRNSDAFVIFDEVYKSIDWSNEDDQQLGEWLPSDLISRVILVNSLSKSCSMTGWRVGYLFANDKIINILKNIQSQSISNVTTIAQHAAVYALKNESRIALDISRELKVKSMRLSGVLNEIDGIKIASPFAGFFCFPDVSDLVQRLGLKNDIELSERLLDDYGLLVVPGVAFGRGGHIRLSYGISGHDMDMLCQILSEV